DPQSVGASARAHRAAAQHGGFRDARQSRARDHRGRRSDRKAIGQFTARLRDRDSANPRPVLAGLPCERANVDPSVLRNDAPDLHIKGDPTLLDRALCNLLENAQKHGAGVESVQLSVLDGKLRVTVFDRGPGFPKESLERVFDAFYRGDGSSSLGLGLSLVERIARAHGGRAWAENRPGGGASVHFEIPAEK